MGSLFEEDHGVRWWGHPFWVQCESSLLCLSGGLEPFSWGEGAGSQGTAAICLKADGKSCPAGPIQPPSQAGLGGSEHNPDTQPWPGSHNLWILVPAHTLT